MKIREAKDKEPWMKQLQIIIDGCKREYEVDGIEEIKRIKKLPCMQQYEQVVDENGNIKKIKRDFPLFMKYTRKISYTKNGKEIDWDIISETKHKLHSRISDEYKCPMNYLQVALDGIKRMPLAQTLSNNQFIIHKNNKVNQRQVSKILNLCYELESIIKKDNDIDNYTLKLNETVNIISNMRIGNINTMTRLIEIALNTVTVSTKRKEVSKYTRTILKLLYKSHPQKFLSCFVQNSE